MALYNCMNQSLRHNLTKPLYTLIRPMVRLEDPFEVIGNREIVGHGINSTYSYKDDPAFPFPAIRFQECTREIMCLREKEKGDWRTLSLEDKKVLYRYSFCQTYAEMNAPTGVWKTIVGKGLFWTSVGIWLYLLMQTILRVPLPESFSEENQKAQLERILALEINPVRGISSQWDYDEQKWK